MNDSLPLAFDIVYCTLSAGAIIYGFVEIWRAMSSTDWPEVTGVIESTKQIRDGSRALTHGALSLPSYYMRIRYRYRVGEHDFMGWRVRFGSFPVPLSRDYSGRLMARYPNDRQVRLRVSPNDPTLSVLEPGLHWNTVALLVIAALMLGFGLRQLLGFLGR